MDTRRFHLRLWISLLLLSFVFVTVRIVWTAPQGNQNLYMPLAGRAEPAPADYLGLTYSSPPSYPQTALPVSEIYTVRGDGSARTRLTTNELHDESPVWSPDGSLILWQQSAERLGTVGNYYSGLWLMNTDGTNARELTNLPGHERGVWSPDGSHIFVIAYDNTSADPFSGTDVYITTPTTITPTLILSDTNLGGEAWAPDGSYFVFATYGGGNLYDIYRVNPDGSGLTLLVEDANQYFEWSPDSTWIVYNKTVAGNQDVYSIRADGSESRRLTTDPAAETFSGWVEAGARVLVRRSTGDSTSVTDLIAIEDSTATPFLTETVYIQGVSPDGASVVYQIVPTAGVTITTLFLKATMGGVAQPVSAPFECGAPACGFNFSGWSDSGRHLAYAFYRAFTPTVNFSQIYITSLEGATPTYYELNDGDGSSSGAQWLPYGDWLGAYADADDGSGRKLHLFNARTGSKLPLPNGEDGRLLIQSEWTVISDK